MDAAIKHKPAFMFNALDVCRAIISTILQHTVGSHGPNLPSHSMRRITVKQSQLAS